MTWRVVTLLVFAVTVFILSTPSVQAQCVALADPAERFRWADAVFMGAVRSTEPTGARGFHIVMHRARFEIERLWKGTARKVEIVGTVERFEPGKRYIVFASITKGLERDSVQYSMSTSLECGWAELEDKDSRTFRWLTKSGIKAAAPFTN